MTPDSEAPVVRVIQKADLLGVILIQEITETPLVETDVPLQEPNIEIGDTIVGLQDGDRIT